MKKKSIVPHAVAAVVLTVICLAAGCDEKSAARSGDLRIVFTREPAGPRNIDPEGTAPLGITTYRVSGSGPNNAELEEIVTRENVITLESLTVGNWVFNATGFNGAEKAIASGSVVTHISGGDNEVRIDLNELVGTGTLSAAFTWNPQQTRMDSVLTARVIDSAGREVEGAAAACDFAAGEATLTMDLPAGYYTLAVSLTTDATLVSGYIETVRIIDRTTSSANRTLVIGKAVDGVSVTIINQTVSPIGGTMTCNPMSPALAQTATLTFAPSLPDGVTVQDLSIQWYRDGEPIDGANALSYTIGSVEAGSCRYDIVIGLPASGSVGSAGALVSVPPVPSVVDPET